MKYAAIRPSVTMDQISPPKSKWLQRASSSIVDIPDAESVLSAPYRPISRRSRAVSESQVPNSPGWGNASPTVALLTSKVGQKEDLLLQQRQRLMAMERDHVLPTQRVDSPGQRLLTATLNAARARQQKLSKLEKGWKTAKSPLQTSVKNTHIDKYLAQVLPASSPTDEFMGSGMSFKRCVYFT